MYKKNVNTLKKESSRKKAMHKSSLIKQAKIAKKQQELLRRKLYKVNKVLIIIASVLIDFFFLHKEALFGLFKCE